jgi:hypothetical protein
MTNLLDGLPVAVAGAGSAVPAAAAERLARGLPVGVLEARGGGCWTAT